MFQMSVSGQWEFVTAHGEFLTVHGEFVTVHREFCDLCMGGWSVGLLDCSRGICDCVTAHSGLTGH